MNIENLRAKYKVLDITNPLTANEKQELYDIAGELFNIVDSLMNGKALNSLHNQIVKLEVENSNLKKRLQPEPKNFHNDIMQDIDPLGQEFG